MHEIFFSASMPKVGRGAYHETANPFLIQSAVREFVIAVIRQYKIVLGGHPTITPMIWNICKDLNVDYRSHVTLYQSRYFEGNFPEENKFFPDVHFTEAVPGDMQKSVLIMREAMLSRPNLVAAVFVGGMEGVEMEYEMFARMHPDGMILPIRATGGAARLLEPKLSRGGTIGLDGIDFASIFHTYLTVPRLDLEDDSKYLTESRDDLLKPTM